MPREEIDRIDSEISYSHSEKLYFAELERDGRKLVVGSYTTEAEARQKLEMHKKMNAARDKKMKEEAEERFRNLRYGG